VHAAASRNRVDAIKCLTEEYGVDYSWEETVRGPLKCCVFHLTFCVNTPFFSLFSLLVQLYQRTPFHIAAMWGNLETVEYLKELGAVIDQTDKVRERGFDIT
jgi:hypothetical protein